MDKILEKNSNGYFFSQLLFQIPRMCKKERKKKLVTCEIYIYIYMMSIKPKMTRNDDFILF